jgi:hypothetical protein
MNTLKIFAWRTKLGFQIWSQRHTAWGFVALALVAAAASGWLLALRPLQLQVADLQPRAATSTAAREAKPLAVAPAAPASVEPQVARLLDDDAQMTRHLERLFVLANQHGLRLRRGEYKPGQLRPISVDSMQVTLPLEGDYATLRGWIAEVLSQMPQASIERIALRRDDIGSSRLQADVVLTLWRKAPASAQQGAGTAAALNTQLAMEPRP